MAWVWCRACIAERERATKRYVHMMRRPNKSNEKHEAYRVQNCQHIPDWIIFSGLGGGDNGIREGGMGMGWDGVSGVFF